MRPFLRRLLFFVLGLLAINGAIALGIIWPVYYSPYFNRASALWDGAYQTFLFADSHGGTIRQAPLTPLGVGNLAIGSDSYIDMLFKLEALVEREATVETILLTVDDHTLSDYRTEADNNPRSALLVSPKVAAKYAHWSVPEAAKRRYVDPYLPMFSPMHAEFTRKWITQNLGRLLDGPSKPETPWHELSVGQRRKRAAHRFEGQFAQEPSAPLEAALLAILDLAEKSGVQVIGMRYPLAPVYLEIIGDRSFGAHQILLERGYEVLDYKYLYANEPGLFSNQDHLNERGVDLFVRQLEEDLSEVPISE